MIAIPYSSRSGWRSHARRRGQSSRRGALAESAARLAGCERILAVGSGADEVTARELRYRVHTPGYRVGEVTLVTTLLGVSVYPAEALADPGALARVRSDHF